MKKIEAVIRQERFSIVKDALDQLELTGITVSEVKGHGAQKGLVQQWRGQQYKIDLLPKLKLEILVEDDTKLKEIIDVIVENARTGSPGDGKIWIWPLENVIRIRTGEEGPKAV